MSWNIIKFITIAKVCRFIVLFFNIKNEHDVKLGFAWGVADHDAAGP